LKIKEGDIFKFGKVVFRVTGLNVKENNNYDMIKSVLTKMTGAEGYNYKMNVSANYCINEINNNNIQENDNKLILKGNTAVTAINYKEHLCHTKEILVKNK
jgi:hypothetical protein